MRYLALILAKIEEIKVKWTCACGNSWVNLSLRHVFGPLGPNLVREGMGVGEYPLGVDGKSNGD